MSSRRRISDRISSPPPSIYHRCFAFLNHTVFSPPVTGYTALARLGTREPSSSFNGRVECLVVLLYIHRYHHHIAACRLYVYATGAGCVIFYSDLRVVTRSRKYARPNVYTAFARPPDSACRYLDFFFKNT